MAMKLSDQIRKKIKLASSGNPVINLLKEVGLITKTSIQGFGRTGKDANKNKFTPDLKPSTVKYHDYLERCNNAGDFYQYDGKRHMNMSGQFFDSIESYEDDTRLTVLIRPTGDRRPYTDLQGKPIGKGRPIPNYELGKILNAKWPMFFLSDAIKRRIVNLVKSYYRRYLTK